MYYLAFQRSSVGAVDVNPTRSVMSSQRTIDCSRYSPNEKCLFFSFIQWLLLIVAFIIILQFRRKKIIIVYICSSQLPYTFSLVCFNVNYFSFIKVIIIKLNTLLISLLLDANTFMNILLAEQVVTNK